MLGGRPVSTSKRCPCAGAADTQCIVQDANTGGRRIRIPPFFWIETGHEFVSAVRSAAPSTFRCYAEWPAPVAKCLPMLGLASPVCSRCSRNRGGLPGGGLPSSGKSRTRGALWHPIRPIHVSDSSAIRIRQHTGWLSDKQRTHTRPVLFLATTYLSLSPHLCVPRCCPPCAQILPAKVPYLASWNPSKTMHGVLTDIKGLLAKASRAQPPDGSNY